MEFLSGIFVGYVLTWPTIWIILFLGIWVDDEEGSGLLATMATIVSGILLIKYSNSLLDAGLYVLGYILIGFAWSFYRYGRFLLVEIDRLKIDRRLPDNEIEANLRANGKTPDRMKSTLTCWTIAWPLSMLGNVLSDVVTFLRNVLNMERVYKKIFEFCTRKLDTESK